METETQLMMIRKGQLGWKVDSSSLIDEGLSRSSLDIDSSRFADHILGSVPAFRAR